MSEKEPRDEYGRRYINGHPPNMRTVRSCETCKHVETHYEGERSCKRFLVAWDDDEDGSEAQPMTTHQAMICDAHEERPA